LGVVIIADLQVGLQDGPPKHDLQSVVDRINQLTVTVRKRYGKVVWIRYGGRTGIALSQGGRSCRNSFASTTTSSSIRGGTVLS